MNTVLALIHDPKRGWHELTQLQTRALLAAGTHTSERRKDGAYVWRALSDTRHSGPGRRRKNRALYDSFRIGRHG